MGFFQLLCFFLCVIHSCLTTAQLTYEHHFCEGANYTTNSPFHHNLNLLLSSLSSNTKNNKKFYNTTIGRDPPEKAYGIFHCRGDVTTEICKNCVESAIKDIIKLCPTQKESIIWHEFCMVRYSNRSIFSTLQEKPSLFLSKVNNVSNPDRFGAILEELMDDLINKAANGTSEAKFATGEASFMNLDKRYGLVQCTPDLTQSDCKKCLLRALHGIPVCCSGKQGGRLIQPSCCLRYDIYPFYGSVVAAAPAPPTPQTRPGISVTNITNTARNAKKSSSIIVIIVVLSFIGLVLLYIIIMRFSSQRRKRKKVDNGEQITSLESLRFHFDTLEAATDNFSDANKLGKGGFGVVYKGRLSNGQEIAVKRLSRNSGQGEEQFKNEVLLVAKLQHRNLVKLLGFCIEGEEKLLIYEFVPNKSLDQFIFDPKKRASLSWVMRYKIIVGIARGLLYLHEDSRHRIIHRDLKVSNILLDAEMNPKISDFGTARLFVVDQTQGITDRIVGTYGYMSPEYAMHGRFSVKSDVYSFGVLLLETLSGQKNNSFCELEHFENLLSYAWRHWKEGTALEMIDPTLRSSFSTSEVMRCIHIGLLCVQEDVSDRPTMATVVLMLGSYYSGTLAVPSRPAFCLHGRMNSNTLTSDLTPPSSVNEMSDTEIYPR